jgi:hypothetical protein
LAAASVLGRVTAPAAASSAAAPDLDHRHNGGAVALDRFANDLADGQKIFGFGDKSLDTLWGERGTFGHA